MPEKKFESPELLRSWLLSSGSVLITSLIYAGQVTSLELSFSRSETLSQAIRIAPHEFVDGPYILQYEYPTDDGEYELSGKKHVMAVSFEAMLSRGDVLAGGLRPLMRELHSFDYSYIFNKTDPAYTTARFWIEEPSDPSQLETLRNVLAKHAVFYAFDDGTGFLSLNNGRMGNGVHSLVKI